MSGGLVDGSGNPVGSDASAHAELLRLLALVAVVRHDLGVTVRAVSNAHHVLATVADGLCGVAALHGLKPTREEILDAVSALQRNAATNGAMKTVPAPEALQASTIPTLTDPAASSAPSDPDTSAPEVGA